MALDLRRRFFAEELEAVCTLRTHALVEALARVARERFLPPGPWTVLSDGCESFMMGAGVRTRTRTTPDANPARVYHNIAVAIDPERRLFNGQPGTLGAWIDALAPGGRMMLPLTAAMPAMGAPLGKGLVLLVANAPSGELAARVITVVAVYSAVGIRDPEMNEKVGKAMTAGPARWMAVKRLRRDAHEASASCWLHGRTSCFST